MTRFNELDYIKEEKIYKGVNKIMEKATVVYAGTFSNRRR